MEKLDGSLITVVMPAYNEAEGIAKVVQDFLERPEVGEVIVVDNNSTDATAGNATAAGARVVHEPNQGYGFACRRALLEAKSDIVAIVESDDTFWAADLKKFLPYIAEFDVVFGTRTSRSCIWAGANMGHFLRYGNCAVAKYLEYLHNGPCLTDVGCTFKILRKRVIKDVSAYWTIGDSSFSPELMILCIRRGWRCVEIPINYGARIGVSKITGSFKKAFCLGLKMIWLITAYRLKNIKRVTIRESE